MDDQDYRTMDPQYYRALLEMFETMGWMLLMKDAEEGVLERQYRALNAKSYEELVFLRGEVAQLSTLLNLKASIEALMEEAE